MSEIGQISTNWLQGYIGNIGIHWTYFNDQYRAFLCLEMNCIIPDQNVFLHLEFRRKIHHFFWGLDVNMPEIWHILKQLVMGIY